MQVRDMNDTTAFIKLCDRFGAAMAKARPKEKPDPKHLLDELHDLLIADLVEWQADAAELLGTLKRVKRTMTLSPETKALVDLEIKETHLEHFRLETRIDQAIEDKRRGDPYGIQRERQDRLKQRTAAQIPNDAASFDCPF